jgi:hypothetical protein
MERILIIFFIFEIALLAYCPHQSWVDESYQFFCIPARGVLSILFREITRFVRISSGFDEAHPFSLSSRREYVFCFLGNQKSVRSNFGSDEYRLHLVILRKKSRLFLPLPTLFPQ